MKLIINSPLDYTNHIRSLINKYKITISDLSRATWLRYTTISRIQKWVSANWKIGYFMNTETFDKIIRHIQELIKEDIEIVYTYSEQK